MGTLVANWYKDQGEYITGALFALLTLDLFMFLIHCITERSIEGYGVGTIFILVAISLVAWIERIYSQQEGGH